LASFNKKAASNTSGRLNGRGNDSLSYRIFSKVKPSTTAVMCLPGKTSSVLPGHPVYRFPKR